MRKNKTKLLILLLLFPMVLSLGLFITNVKGVSNIPEPSPKNSWHWGVDVGDTFMFESELIMTDFFTHEVINMYRNIDIYNITAFLNITGGFSGTYPYQRFSEIIVESLWEDTVGELSVSAFGSFPLCIFGYNDTLKKHFYQIGAGGITPFVFPINDTILDISLMSSIYNETFLTPVYENQRTFNKFDELIVDVGNTEFTFKNSTDGYYFRASYYPNNGTLKDMDAYYVMDFGGWKILNVSGKRVFNHDVTDELVWGVDIGDEIYYYANQSGSTFLARLTIEGFNKTVYWSSNWTMMGIEWPMVFEDVFISMSAWNGTDWVLLSTNPITAANNFYPMCLQHMRMYPQSGLILPTSTTVEDFIFLFNNYTADITGWFPFDTFHYDVSGNVINVTMTQSGNGQVSVGIYNLDMGLVELQYATYLGKIQLWFELADMEWDVDIGDYLYFKQNFDENMQELRYIVKSIEYSFVDVTVLGYPKPAGHPKYQFFSEVYADLSIWMKDTETWSEMGTYLLADASEYWPIAPDAMIGGMPFIVPKETAASELQNNFNMLLMWYDDIVCNPGHIILRNTTASKELHFYFNETSGRMKYIGGDNFAAHKWWHLSAYPENIRNLDHGSPHIELSDDFDMETAVTVDIDNVAIGVVQPDFIYALLPYNPVGVPLPNGTALLYLDHKITNHSLITTNITMTIDFPSSIDLSEIIVYIYSWNVTGSGEWELAPPEFYQHSVNYEVESNRMWFEIEVIGPYMYLSAISYEVMPEDGTPPIPGYDLFFLSLVIITVSTLIVKKLRKKK